MNIQPKVQAGVTAASNSTPQTSPAVRFQGSGYGPPVPMIVKCIRVNRKTIPLPYELGQKEVKLHLLQTFAPKAFPEFAESYESALSNYREPVENGFLARKLNNHGWLPKKLDREKKHTHEALQQIGTAVEQVDNALAALGIEQILGDSKTGMTVYYTPDFSAANRQQLPTFDFPVRYELSQRYSG